MVYVEDDEYWDQALSRTEHFLFHKLRRLRPPANGANAYEEDVFSLSADGERLTQRTYAETRARWVRGRCGTRHGDTAQNALLCRVNSALVRGKAMNGVVTVCGGWWCSSERILKTEIGSAMI